MKAVFLDFGTLGPDGTGVDKLDISPLTDAMPDLQFFDHTYPDEIPDRIRDAELVLVNKVQLTKEILESAPSVKYVGLIATGVDNVDVETARNLGIAVSNIRAYCTQSVVEYVFATLLSLSHNIDRYRSSVRDGQWQKSKNFCLLDFPIRELSAMKLGIVGFGELGGGVAAMAQQFNMNVLVSARPGAATCPTDRIPFSTLLRECDVLSLHCPLTDQTKDLIGADELAAMKPNAILINTARGGLVNSNALVNALKNQQIAAAAIDVLASEPPPGDDALLGYRGDNLVLTPHIAWATVEARQNAINHVAQNVSAFLDGKRLNRVD